MTKKFDSELSLDISSWKSKVKSKEDQSKEKKIEKKIEKKSLVNDRHISETSKNISNTNTNITPKQTLYPNAVKNAEQDLQVHTDAETGIGTGIETGIETGSELDNISREKALNAQSNAAQSNEAQSNEAKQPAPQTKYKSQSTNNFTADKEQQINANDKKSKLDTPASIKAKARADNNTVKNRKNANNHTKAAKAESIDRIDLTKPSKNTIPAKGQQIGVDARVMDMIKSISGKNISAKKSAIKKIKQVTRTSASIKKHADCPQPIVVIVGHIDHGKTTLIDYIRESKITAKEAGEITQKIGVYLASSKHGEITILDTPGHAVFKNMRGTGTLIADIAVLIIDARDGIKEQTVESIKMCQSANLNMIVAINKVDLPDAEPEKIERDLVQYNLLTESMGGDVACCHISAKTGQGVTELLETISIMHSMQYTKDENSDIFVINSEITPKLGRSIIAIMKHGILKKGDFIIIGNEYTKIRRIHSISGKNITHTEASIPFVISGIKNAPKSADMLRVVDNETDAKQIALAAYDDTNDKKSINTERILADMKKGTLNVVLKASCDSALQSMRILIENKAQLYNIKINIVSSSVGDVSDSDFIFTPGIELNKFRIIGFDITNSTQLSNSNDKSVIITSNLIQEISDQIDDFVKSTDVNYDIIGQATIKEIFDMKNIGYVCGCYVDQGVVKVNAKVYVLRNDDIILHSKIISLKIHKDQITEQKENNDCGIIVKDGNLLRQGDIIVCYK